MLFNSMFAQTELNKRIIVRLPVRPQNFTSKTTERILSIYFSQQ